MNTKSFLFIFLYSVLITLNTVINQIYELMEDILANKIEEVKMIINRTPFISLSRLIVAIFCKWQYRNVLYESSTLVEIYNTSVYAPAISF